MKNNKGNQLDFPFGCHFRKTNSTSVRTNNSTSARLGWGVQPDLDSALLFTGMRKRSIRRAPHRKQYTSVITQGWST